LGRGGKYLIRPAYSSLDANEPGGGERQRFSVLMADLTSIRERKNHDGEWRATIAARKPSKKRLDRVEPEGSGNSTQERSRTKEIAASMKSLRERCRCHMGVLRVFSGGRGAESASSKHSLMKKSTDLGNS